MTHKVRCDVSFENMDEYLLMKRHLDNAGIKFDSFVSYSLNHTWNLMLEQHAKQIKEEEVSGAEPAGHEFDGDKEEVSFGEGTNNPAPSDESAVSP